MPDLADLEKHKPYYWYKRDQRETWSNHFMKLNPTGDWLWTKDQFTGIIKKYKRDTKRLTLEITLESRV